jgi:hypothetical protein
MNKFAVLIKIRDEMRECQVIEDRLRGSALFSDLSDELITGLVRKSMLVHCEKNEALLSQDEPATYCFYLLEGTSSYHGQRQMAMRA